MSSSIKLETVDIAIIGGGLAGLTAAVELQRAGRSPVIFEASDRVGGRVRSDCVDGYTLDHGFQVLLTAYPTCQKLLDYDALDLRPFPPGAMIRMDAAFHVLGDPWRRPSTAWGTLRNPVGSLLDKCRIAKVRSAAASGTLADVYQRPDQSTVDYLRQTGFSDRMIDGFFRPFLGGVFLDESLSVSRRMFDFVFRFFAAGDVVVPASGMEAIPKQLASHLATDAIRIEHTIAAIKHDDGLKLVLTDGDEVAANQILIATESNAADRLLSGASDKPTSKDQPARSPATIATQWNGTVNVYYSCRRLDDATGYLCLKGNDDGPIQTATVLSAAAPEYAPPGRSLISVSLTGNEDNIDWDDFGAVDDAIRGQVADWFGADDLTCLAIYRIPYGLPQRDLDPVERSVRATDFGGPAGVFLAGDHLSTPSIEGAMASGVRAAAAILESSVTPQGS